MPDTTIVNNYSQSVGTSNTNPFVTHFDTRNPTAQDVNYPVQKRWINAAEQAEFILVNFSSSGGVITANWMEITGGLPLTETLTGNSGGAVEPDGASNIDVIGDTTTINIVGSPGSHSLTANVILPGTAHQVLVGEISSIAGISPSTAGFVLTSNGIGSDPSFQDVPFPLAFTSIVVQVFTGSGTYTPTSGMKYCILEAVGGGGGGAGSEASTAGKCDVGGGGGGAGYARKTASASTIGASQPIVIGASGAGGISGADGGSGGTTTVGIIISATGGSGGTTEVSGPADVAVGTGGPGGSGSGGDVNVRGSTGGNAFGSYGITSLAAAVMAGNGGSSYFGGGATAQTAYGSSVAGNSTSSFGGGGSGGASGSTSASTAPATSGGNGGSGIVVITEFLS